MGYILRVLAAFGLLSLTYNPTQYNFARWAEANWSAQMPLAVLFGLLLLVGYIIYLRATLRSIGLFGMCLVLALVAALLWVASDYGWAGVSASNFIVICWQAKRRGVKQV